MRPDAGRRPLLIRHGVRGVRKKRVTSKRQEYTGNMAVLVGAIQAATGVIVLVGAFNVLVMG